MPTYLLPLKTYSDGNTRLHVDNPLRQAGDTETGHDQPSVQRFPQPGSACPAGFEQLDAARVAMVGRAHPPDPPESLRLVVDRASEPSSW